MEGRRQKAEGRRWRIEDDRLRCFEKSDEEIHQRESAKSASSAFCESAFHESRVKMH